MDGEISKHKVKYDEIVFQTVGYDPVVSEADALQCKITKMSREEVFYQSDYLTVHTPLIPQTKRESVLLFFFFA